MLKIGENHKVIPRYHLPLVGRHFVFGLVTAPVQTMGTGLGRGNESKRLSRFANQLSLFIHLESLLLLAICLPLSSVIYSRTPP